MSTPTNTPIHMNEEAFRFREYYRVMSPELSKAWDKVFREEQQTEETTSGTKV
jgi:hypothetical protein